MENKDSKDIENKVMSEIKSGKIKLRSRYIFLAEKLGMESAFVLSVILSVLFFNLFLFYLKTTDNLQYLSFGQNGIAAFLESFPYPLIVGFITFLLLSGYLMMKADFSYKKPFKYFAVILMVIVMIAGTVLAFTDMSEKIEQQAFGDGLSGVVLKPFLNRAVGLHQNGISGRVIEVGEKYCILEIPNGLQKVDFHNLKFDDKFELEKNQFIVAIGERKEDVFIASQIRIVQESDIPMIGRGIRRGQMNNCNGSCQTHNGFIIKNEEMKKCMDECFELSSQRRRCFDDCAVE
ncbi:MAG: hypothetical protein KAI67_05010 [Candidatus Pacebacteria bacterium]|nr:hypothetical protein [Candidatus Paceibacterota bacterium]